MKKIYLLFIAATLAACSAEPLENEALTGLDANLQGKSNKAATQDAGESFNVPENICAGEEVTFTFEFSDKPGNTALKVQLYGDDPETEEEVVEWYNIFNEQASGGGPEYFYYTFEEARDYSIRYQIGGGGFTEVTVTVENCGCEESFNYTLNEGGTYTFTYVPEEDMIDAEVVFTFAQSVDVLGFNSDWNWHGQTMQTEMNLDACTPYSWDLTLIKKCDGNPPNNNVWTDFKVRDDSKKGDLVNITQSCQ